VSQIGRGCVGFSRAPDLDDPPIGPEIGDDWGDRRRRGETRYAPHASARDKPAFWPTLCTHHPDRMMLE
jgi:hypothetical protein